MIRKSGNRFSEKHAPGSTRDRVREKDDAGRSGRRLAGLARRLHGIGNAAADQDSILSDRRRLAEQIALHPIAAFMRQETELLRGFDALGDDRHFEAMAEVDDGADDCRRLRIFAEIDDEVAVNLDLVERERLQIAQRGVAAAEIVHRDPYPERLEPPQQRQTTVEILD